MQVGHEFHDAVIVPLDLQRSQGVGLNINPEQVPVAPDNYLGGARWRRRWLISAEHRAWHGGDGRTGLARRRCPWPIQVKRFVGAVEPRLDIGPEQID